MASSPSMADRFLAELKTLQQSKGGLKVEDIRGVIERFCSANETLLHELRDLFEKINHTRQEIGAVETGKISADFIPTAHLELEAIVKATENATNTILDAAEKIQALSQASPEGAAITQEVSKIFEACNFQDITGQRISKVVQTLLDIEQALRGMLKEPASAPAGPKAAKTDGPIDEKSLMNGPQLKQPTQEDIDKLFDSL